ncbi:hypothetical protein JCM8547_004753 [Rhodosporidiobolus lusitaniae]
MPSLEGPVGVVVGPCLVTRSPAIQPCDVQLVTGVFKEEYRTYRDVIIVSAKTNGNHSLCSLLSGGDYDGASSNVGHLFCRALDGRKQGLSFSPEKWLVAKAKFFEPFKEKPDWTYRGEGGEPPGNVKLARMPDELGKHVMDDLVKEGKRALIAVNKEWEEWYLGKRVEVDPDLADEWTVEWAAAHVRTIKDAYSALFVSWNRARQSKDAEQKALEAAGSPTKKSPSKGKGEWELRRRSRRRSSLPCRGGSKEGEGAHAYIDWLVPTNFNASPEKPLLKRFLAANHPSLARPPSAASAASSATLASPSKTTLAAAVITVTAAKKDEDGDEVFEDAADSFENEDDFRWSQVPDTRSQLVAAETTIISSTMSSQTLASATSSQTLTTTAISSSHPSAPASPTPVVPPLAFAPHSPALPRYPSSSDLGDFSDGSRLKTRFCYDMAHQDVLAPKADALTRRLHGGSEGSFGIQAPKIAPWMLDVLAVSKRCAGITKARTKVRPRSLLPPARPDTPLIGASPTKKRRM